MGALGAVPGRIKGPGLEPERKQDEWCGGDSPPVGAEGLVYLSRPSPASLLLSLLIFLFSPPLSLSTVKCTAVSESQHMVLLFLSHCTSYCCFWVTAQGTTVSEALHMVLLFLSHCTGYCCFWVTAKSTAVSELLHSVLLFWITAQGNAASVSESLQRVLLSHCK